MEYWASYLYLYGVGGALFFGVLLLALKKKSLILSKRDDALIFWGLTLSFGSYAVVQGIWNYYAIVSLP